MFMTAVAYGYLYLQCPARACATKPQGCHGPAIAERLYQVAHIIGATLDDVPPPAQPFGDGSAPPVPSTALTVAQPTNPDSTDSAAFGNDPAPPARNTALITAQTTDPTATSPPREPAVTERTSQRMAACRWAIPQRQRRMLTQMTCSMPNAPPCRDSMPS